MALSQNEVENWKRERQISNGWAKEAERADALEALCRQLAEACQYGLNLTLNGIGQHSHAVVLFESAIEAAKKAKVIDG